MQPWPAAPPLTQNFYDLCSFVTTNGLAPFATTGAKQQNGHYNVPSGVGTHHGNIRSKRQPNPTIPSGSNEHRSGGANTGDGANVAGGSGANENQPNHRITNQQPHYVQQAVQQQAPQTQSHYQPQPGGGGKNSSLLGHGGKTYHKETTIVPHYQHYQPQQQQH